MYTQIVERTLYFQYECCKNVPIDIVRLITITKKSGNCNCENQSFYYTECATLNRTTPLALLEDVNVTTSDLITFRDGNFKSAIVLIHLCLWKMPQSIRNILFWIVLTYIRFQSFKVTRPVPVSFGFKNSKRNR